MASSRAPTPAQITEYKKLIRNVVNPRLKRLEAQALKPGQGNITSFAYRKLGIEGTRFGIINITAKGGIRVSTAVPKTARQLARRMELLKSFVDMPTSTKTGYQEVVNNRLEGFNKAMRKAYRGHWTNMSLEEFDQFWGEVNAGNLDKEFYKSYLKVLNKMQTKAKKDEVLRKQIERYEERKEFSKTAKIYAEDNIKKHLIKQRYVKAAELEGLDLPQIISIASKFI